MRLYRFKSIRTKLLFWFLLLSIIPFLGAFIITYFQRVNSIDTEAFDKLIAIRDLKTEQLDNWLNERLGDVFVMSEDFEIRDLEETYKKESKSPEDLNRLQAASKLLNRYLANYIYYDELMIINSNSGLVELSTNPDNIGSNRSNNSYYTGAMETGKVFIKDIYLSETTKRPDMTISIPIYCLTHNIHIIGVLVARMNLDRSLYDLLDSTTGLGETGETLIVNENIIALNKLRHYSNAPLNLKINSEPAILAARGETGTFISTDYRGRKVFAAYTNIEETGWGFVCKQDVKELHAQLRIMVFQFSIVFIVSVIIIVLVSISRSKSFLRPIAEMVRISRKIIQGDFSERNTINSGDELESLGQEINTMIDTTVTLLTVQKAGMDISEVMINQSSMKEFGNALLRKIMEVTDANMSTFYILNEETSEFEHFSSIGANEELLNSFSAENYEGEFGNVLTTKQIYHLRNIPEDTKFKFKTIAGDAIPKEIITIPVLIEKTVVALISLVSIHSFTKESSDILKLSWNTINSSYSGLMSGERIRILAEYLSSTNQQLEAQAEELQEQSEELQEQTEELQTQTEELQRTSEELQEQNIELEVQQKQVGEANRLKSEFLSNMSHELRTPLNSIMSLSRVLIMQAKNKLTEEENNYLEIVERNGKQLLSLINDILDLSKIEAGKMDVNPEFISLNSLLNSIRDNFMPIVNEKGLELKLEIKADLPEIETDGAKLHQVLQNIISNSVKFTEKGNIDIKVDFDSEKVYIDIRDTGIGIPQNEQSNIFDEFRQIDGSSSRQYQGTGLGLAIVSKLLKVLNGDIELKSKTGEGSLFSIILPLMWQGEIEESDIQTFKPLISQSKRKKNSETRILIVEDNEHTIFQIKAVLENEEYLVDVAKGGIEALEYIQHTIPDGIILDLMMPEMDGFEVLKSIRSTELTRDIPVLILTAKDLSKKDLSKLSANNIQQLVQKGGVNIDNLLNEVKLMLGDEPAAKKTETGEKINAIKKNIRKEGGKEDMTKSIGKKDLPNILIVEDNPDNMTTIKAIIKEDYAVLEAYDGKQGLKTAISKLPDAILLDMALPEMEGIEVVRRLKSKKETMRIPVIAVTASAMKEDEEAFRAAGCDGYIAKPIDAEALLGEIRRLLKISGD